MPAPVPRVVVPCGVCGAMMSHLPWVIKQGRKFCGRACSDKGRQNGTHGQARTRLYVIWCGIKERCQPGSNHAVYYHDRGIRVCPEWASSFETFRAWALATGYTDDLEIDRRDNDKGYEPENCRWATRQQQNANRRKRTGCTSRFRGVSWSTRRGKWQVHTRFNGKSQGHGLYADEEEAARAYDREARRLFGEFANPNFKE